MVSLDEEIQKDKQKQRSQRLNKKVLFQNNSAFKAQC